MSDHHVTELELLRAFEKHQREHESCGPCAGIGVFLEVGTLKRNPCKPCDGTGWIKKHFH